VHEGIVFVNFDQDGEAAIIAVDAKTGKRRWAVPREAHRACYSTPMIRERGKQSELIVTSTTSIAAYEPQTGKEIWKWSWSPRGLRTTASSIMNDGLIFAAGGDGSGERHFVAVKLPDASSPAPGLAWELKKGTPYVPCPLYHDGHLYWVNDRGFAGCVEAATGKEVWNERLADTFHASPVLIDGRVYAPNEKGVVYVFEAKPKYKLLAKNDLKEVIAASPAVADGRIYIRGEKHLFCFASK
jgi:outer membrane protein assembly factor BamB